MPQPQLVSSVRNLLDPEILESHFGSFHSLETERMNTNGYSGASFTKIILQQSNGNEIRLILKEVSLAADWFSHRTKDILGREAAVLLESQLSEITSIFHSPYLLASMESGRIGMLMADLSEGLFPDEKKPLSINDQDLMLGRLAWLHAHYWQFPELNHLSWLHKSSDFIYLMGPFDHVPFEGGSTRNIQDHIKTGWLATIPLLPPKVREAFLLPPDQIVSPWADLPKTLIHGDTKVANFAKAKNGDLCLLDWAFVGHAPCTFDLGWFLAVNASRLAESKEVVIEKYRNMLESALGFSITEELWQRLEEAGLVCGAFMLLWSKGNAMANGSEGARTEWDWWMNRLEKWAEHLSDI